MFERVLTKKPKMEIIHPDEELFLKGDHSVFEQIISNLLMNANDAIDDFGKIGIKIETVCAKDDNFIKLLESYDSNWIRITVKDDGVGISKEHMDKIFEPFFTTKESGKGIGLGLANVYGSVKQMGGHIFVESEVNKGTSFYLYFPMVYPDNLVNHPHESEDKTELNLPKNVNVLVVEDEETVASALINLLTNYQVKVFYAKNGSEGFNLFMSNKIDILITDIMMPGMKGDLLADMCRAINEKLKVIFITGNSSGTNEKNVLTKPFKKEQLFLMMNKMFEDEL